MVFSSRESGEWGGNARSFNELNFLQVDQFGQEYSKKPGLFALFS
jgi:hypothetical protein